MKIILPFEHKSHNKFWNETNIDEARQSIKDNYDTIISLIKETIAHYNEGNRASTGTSCNYKTEAGNMCAVGRCLTEDALKDFHVEEAEMTFGIENMSSALTEKYPCFDSMFQEKYQGVHIKVWGVLQGLHDYDEHWDAEGLAEDGKKYILENLGTEIYNDVFGV
jgi:hypothetical protein